MSNSTLNVIEHRGFKEAMEAATQEAASTNGRSFIMTLFRQGNRNMLAGAFTYPMVREYCINTPAKKGSSVYEMSLRPENRPNIPGHSHDISSYIQDNLRGSYILGALTLTIRQKINFHTMASSSGNRMGFLVLPYGARIDFTDGGHRNEAIKLCFSRMNQEDVEEFSTQSIAAILVAESDVKQIHQDFADASKSKPIPPALLTAFDLRNPANSVVLRLESESRLLAGLIDATSKSISKTSKKVFTASQIRQFVKVILTGNWQLGVSDFDEKAREMFKNREDFENKISMMLEYLNFLCGIIPVWKTVSNLDRANAEDMGQILEIKKERHVCLSSSGLILIAKIGHELFFKTQYDFGKDWKDYALKLGVVDWSVTSGLWQGNIVQPDSMGQPRVLQQQNLIRTATAKLREAIGLSNPGA